MNISQIVEFDIDVGRILFAYAWGGCDTTSTMHTKGKTHILNLLENSDVKEMPYLFGDLYMDQDDVGCAGTKIAVTSYNGKENDTPASLRHVRFMENVTSLTLRPQHLPPSKRTVYFPALHVLLQVCQWSTLDLECLSPLDWGWCQVKDTLEPIETDLKPAPVDMLSFFWCHCKTSSKKTWFRLCSCFCSGLKCVAACQDI